MWYRVFGLLADEVTPDRIAEHLRSHECDVRPHFRGDDLGWTSGELHLAAGGSPVNLNRYLTHEDDLRAELNAFAAELETRDYDSNSIVLMQHVIQTQQLITLRKPIDAPDEIALDNILLEVCRLIAHHTNGVYQIDDVGWFAANGTLMLQEY